MVILIAGERLLPENPNPFEPQKFYKGQLDDKLKELENTMKAFEHKHKVILKYKAQGCEEELGCIIFMETVNLETF